MDANRCIVSSFGKKNYKYKVPSYLIVALIDFRGYNLQISSHQYISQI